MGSSKSSGSSSLGGLSHACTDELTAPSSAPGGSAAHAVRQVQRRRTLAGCSPRCCDRHSPARTHSATAPPHGQRSTTLLPACPATQAAAAAAPPHSPTWGHQEAAGALLILCPQLCGPAAACRGCQTALPRRAQGAWPGWAACRAAAAARGQRGRDQPLVQQAGRARHREGCWQGAEVCREAGCSGTGQAAWRGQSTAGPTPGVRSDGGMRAGLLHLAQPRCLLGLGPLAAPLRPAQPHNPLPSRPHAPRNPSRDHPSAPRHRRRTLHERNF